MDRYFSHVRDGTDVLFDPEGRELGDMADRERNLGDARSLLSRAALDRRVNLNERIDVEDDSGEVVHSLWSADAVEIIPVRQ